MSSAPRTITISVTRTIQVRQYEPVGVTVTESIQVKDDDTVPEKRKELYRDVTKQVKSYLDNEYTKYTKDDKEKKRGSRD